jgi:hypothetical protein
MNNLTKLSVLLLLFFTLSITIETSAQIHEIKKKSSSNNNNRSSSSSSKSSGSTKKKSSRSRTSSRSSSSDVDASDIFGCLSTLFDVAGCLFNAIESSETSSSEYASNDYNYYDDNDYYQPEEPIENNPKVKGTYSEPEIKEEIKTEIPKKKEENKVLPVRSEEPATTNKTPELTDNKLINKNNLSPKEKGKVNLDIRAHFDLSMHKGIDKNYLHVDYLPGIRANFDIFLLDFRYNVLTEYTDDFPNSFKSWELLALFNLTARRDYSIIIGTGFQREQFDEGISFNEWYIETKIPLKNKKDYIDIDTRFSKDYKTKEFPFFEFGGRYNVRFLNEKNVSGYFTFGATYQNYYQSYDIWGIRGGVVLNIH